MKRVTKINKGDNSGTLEQYLDEFCLFKLAQGRAQRTVSDVASLVKLFFKRYHRTTKKGTSLKTNALLFLSEEGIAPATYNLRLINLKGFFNYCVENNYLEVNPLVGIKKRRAPARIVNIPIEVLNELLKAPDKTNSYTGLRDYCMMLTQCDCGLRPNEVCTLSVTDINIEAAQVTVKAENAKTRVKRTLPLSKVTLGAIKALLEVRPDEWGKMSTLFCSYNGGFFNPNSYCHKLAAYSKQIGHRVTPYDLRHIFALNFLRNGGNSFALMKMMGHTDMSMTKRYIALTDDDLKEAHAAASPVNMIVSYRKRIR